MHDIFIQELQYYIRIGFHPFVFTCILSYPPPKSSFICHRIHLTNIVFELYIGHQRGKNEKNYYRVGLRFDMRGRHGAQRGI